MPTYEYECQKCHHRFEKFQSMTDKPVSRCPKCKGKTRRLFGPGAGIIFKGSGFYATDYRKSSCSSSGAACGHGAGKGHGKAPSGSPASGAAPASCPGKTEGCHGCPAAGSRD